MACAVMQMIFSPFREDSESLPPMRFTFSIIIAWSMTCIKVTIVGWVAFEDMGSQLPFPSISRPEDHMPRSSWWERRVIRRLSLPTHSSQTVHGRNIQSHRPETSLCSPTEANREVSHRRILLITICICSCPFLSVAVCAEQRNPKLSRLSSSY
ncbi:hypothetical protein PYCCODRAFT_255931 [Trametes coccinea BRFM310]|uniref:Uncharacterized protein n=1 Tax=Trametes coccinea (strain BRFM310) TaxID=1353009 RepID=A0A1Y2IQ68_TRAC3|nr:hypothetical protein PYCCODRAFT_255931 [Trametes coccinea BRFM310]